MKLEIKSRFDAVLYSGEAHSILELLQNAVKDHARLTRASLYEADLNGARLTRASLDGARLDGASLDGEICTGRFIQLVNVAEWGTLLAFQSQNGLRIKVGCRHFSMSEARSHWAERGDRVKTRLALDMVDLWYAQVPAVGAVAA